MIIWITFISLTKLSAAMPKDFCLISLTAAFLSPCIVSDTHKIFIQRVNGWISDWMNDKNLERKFLRCIYVNLMYFKGLWVESIVWIKKLDNNLE